MSESLKRVSMVLLALAITLGLSGVLTLGITNNVKATDSRGNHCPGHQDTGWALDKEESATGDETVDNVRFRWSVIDTENFDGKLIVRNNNSYAVQIFWCAKGGNNFYEGSKNTGKIETLLAPDERVVVKFRTEISYFMVYEINKVEEPKPTYQLTFEKKWDGDEFDKTNVEVTFINKEGQTAKPGEVITGDDIFPGAKVEELKEEVTGLPENCSVVSNDIQPLYILFEDMIEERISLLSLDNDVPINGEGMTYTDTITVTNTVDCEEPRQPVTPEGETETPVTTTTQVTATPTGSVDAGAGANLVVSLVGLISSAAVVASGVFLRRSTGIGL